MKLCLLTAALLVLFALPASAQVNPEERRFFALGVTLSRGAFAYAELAKQAAEVARTHSRIDQVRPLGRLDPLAGRSRTAAREQFAAAGALMRGLTAPPPALGPVDSAEKRLAGPLPITSEARPLALLSRPAARTVSALSEFQSLSSLPEYPAIRRWLGTPGLPRDALAWYEAGRLAGLAQIAAANDMPELLPPNALLAADLRGLQERLALSLPAAPSSTQTGLQNDLDALLRQTAAGGPQARLTPPQLQSLGSISVRMQAQVLKARSEPNF